MEGNFAQSAKDKRKCKAEGRQKRDHIGSCERKGRGQRAGGWRKGENTKNKTKESAIVRENLFHCFPGYNHSEQDIVFTLCMLPRTVYQVRMAGLPLQDPQQQLDQCQKETNLLNPDLVHRLFKLFLRAWWRVIIGLHWVWAYVEGNGISKKQKWGSFISEACEISSRFHHDRQIILWPFRNIPEATVKETYCQEMLLTIFIGLLAKTEPCSLMIGWQLIREWVTHGNWPQEEVTAGSGLNLTIFTRDLGI